MTRLPLGRGADPVPCVKCDRREVGLSWGDYCSVCREEQEGAANRIARRVAVIGAALLGASLVWQGLPDLKARLFGAVSAVLVYLILRRLVSRGVLEYRRRNDSKALRIKER